MSLRGSCTRRARWWAVRGFKWFDIAPLDLSLGFSHFCASNPTGIHDGVLRQRKLRGERDINILADLVLDAQLSFLDRHKLYTMGPFEPCGSGRRLACIHFVSVCSIVADVPVRGCGSGWRLACLHLVSVCSIAEDVHR